MAWKEKQDDSFNGELADLVCGILPNRGFNLVTTAPKKCERADYYHPSEYLAISVAAKIGVEYKRLFRQRDVHRVKGARGRKASPMPELFVTSGRGWVLLVDDVVCSGATAANCAKVLRGAGYNVETVAAVFWDRAATK